MSSRYLKDLELRRSKIIHIYRNGDSYSRATFVILRLPEQVELDRIIKAIEEKVKLPLNRPIRKLFELNGTLVENPSQIEDGKYYVAASAENYCSINYGHPANWVFVGPVKTNKYANVHYTTRAEEFGEPKKLSSSNDVLSSDRKTPKTPTSRLIPNKSSQVEKKPTPIKKYSKKDMTVSEHVDKILDDGYVAETKSMDGNPETEEKHIEINEADHETEEVFNVNEKADKLDRDENVNHPHEDVHQEDAPEHFEDKITEDVHQITDEKKVEIQEFKPEEVKFESVNDEFSTNITEENITENLNTVSKSYDIDNQEVDSPETKPDIQENVLGQEDNAETNENPIETKDDVHENIPADPPADNQDVDEDLSNEAATKIQATYREDSIDEGADISEAVNNTEENI